MILQCDCIRNIKMQLVYYGEKEIVFEQYLFR
jgi:hypothetical protein